MANLRATLQATAQAWQTNLRCLFESGQFILGTQVELFEQELAAAFGAKFAVGVGSGTSAVELCLRAAGLGESGDEVIVPALTSPFTAQAVLAAGCRLRFADVDAAHLLLDPPGAGARAGKGTRAVLPVLLYGQPYDLRPLESMGLPLVQDACQAHGAANFSQASSLAAFSFYPTKNLPCLGDGGAVVTNSRRLAERARLLRDGGRLGDQVARVRAINSRLDEIQACYLRAFLPKLAEWNAERSRLALVYDEALADCEGVTPVARRPGSVCHLYVVRARGRDRLRRFLADRGIGTGAHYPAPLHLQPAFREYGGKRGSLPVAERSCREVVSLPLWPGMGDQAVEEVADSVSQFYRRPSTTRS